MFRRFPHQEFLDVLAGFTYETELKIENTQKDEKVYYTDFIFDVYSQRCIVRVFTPHPKIHKVLTVENIYNGNIKSIWLDAKYKFGIFVDFHIRYSGVEIITNIQTIMFEIFINTNDGNSEELGEIQINSKYLRNFIGKNLQC